MSGNEEGRDCRRSPEDGLERLYRYLDGALTPEDVERVREHIDACPDCSHQRELEMLIRSAVRRSCQEKAPAQLRAAILTRITQVRVTHG